MLEIKTLNQKLEGWGPAICSPLSNYDACHTLRITAICYLHVIFAVAFILQ